MSNEYREGDDPPKPPEAPKPEQGRPENREWFTQTGRDPIPPPPPESDPEQFKGRRLSYPGSEDGQQVYTAVLLVQTMHGVVVPITALPSVNMHHAASPHEVFRMAADIADQLSTTRAIGQLLSDGDERLRYLLEGLHRSGAFIPPQRVPAQGTQPQSGPSEGQG